jgi:hypothetical protein
MATVIYIETTIPSFYSETRQDAESVIRRKWTRDWWSNASKSPHRLVTSQLVLEELSRIPIVGRREESLALAGQLELVDYNEDVIELSKLYIQRKLMPQAALGDADHLALASIHRCDMLLTWNCRHLANANKIAQLRRINALLDLPTPLLITPLQLVGIK